MEEKACCPFCENFEASCFMVQGKLQAFRFCPVCGRRYASGEARRTDGCKNTESDEADRRRP